MDDLPILLIGLPDKKANTAYTLYDKYKQACY